MSSKRKNQSGAGEASQFFHGQDVETQNATIQATSERVIDLLNQAQLANVEEKLNYLKQVQELIVNKDPTLLDNFLDEVLIFQQDRHHDIRKFVVLFIEETCKKDPELLSKTVGCLTYMLDDENISVRKRVMLACNSLYKIALQLVCKLRSIKEDVREMWECMCELKRHICGMIESDNDGVRTHVVKFMEMLILVHSKSSEVSSQGKKDGDITLDVVPSNHPLVKQSELLDEGLTTMEALLAMCASPNISSVNLMAVLSSLTNIGKQRPSLLHTIIQSFESLHANLPPTLSKSQVSSVRKTLKMQLFTLLKLPSAAEHITQIGTLLSDLGATAIDIQKGLPKITDQRIKKPEDDIKIKKKDEKSDEHNQFSLTKAIDLTTEDIVSRLNKSTVTDLVIVSMLFLPRTMPSHFLETFTPIAAAGGQAQKEHLARLMATQMTNAGVGIGLQKAKEMAAAEASLKKEESDKIMREPKSIPVLGSEKVSDIKIKNQPRSIRDIAADLKSGSKLDVSGARLRKIKPFRLQDVVQVLSSEDRNKMLVAAYKRILQSDKQAVVSGCTVERNKILVGLAMQFYGELTDILIHFVMEDFRTRIDLGILWLYQEYINTETQTPGQSREHNSRYALCLRNLIEGMKKHLEPRDKLFTRFILEAPCLPDGVRRIIKDCCMDPDRLMVGFSTLRELISKNPAASQEWLQLLLELTTAEREQVRVQAIHSAKKLHSKPEFSAMIGDFALHSLQQLLLERPPLKELPNDKEAFEVTSTEWTDDSIKAYLYLYLALLPTNHVMFLNLADVYVDASPVIKRTILRHLEHPIRAIGMNSPELLRLVENCPTGAETLVTRVLHIVTDKSPPTPELVQKVKELYQKRVSDVRFLIPVLNGLNKAEVINVLPQLISQSPNVVKEVFNRLLGSFQTESAIPLNPPLSPAELLVALHTIESNSDVKAIMKAINICFCEKQIYTQEVLAVVIQQLMEISPIPTLFMRTVIQSFGMCPRLVGFVMNILSKLISKQVWKYPKVWQGFVKCCQMTKPQSYPVLLKLPPNQLESVFEISPEMKEPLIKHIESLTANQRSHIPKAILQLLDIKEISATAVDPSASYASGEKRKRKAEPTKEVSSRETVKRKNKKINDED
ncbi:symplekin isoform X1 [Hydra vulgaris]|uniref:symplekin isoform X1 n=1 Tax=Hydra vulgaris TaxID=6087 RepID=UPI001F5F03FB|nr:symplekin-like [Hydra vulgaris]